MSTGASNVDSEHGGQPACEPRHYSHLHPAPPRDRPAHDASCDIATTNAIDCRPSRTRHDLGSLSGVLLECVSELRWD
ncbi:hypothetical protein NL676_007973 [Syzygium grande]|nr:hypothetical protein NL676_007973 [Syzygium grande]